MRVTWSRSDCRLRRLFQQDGFSLHGAYQPSRRLPGRARQCEDEYGGTTRPQRAHNAQD